jgi:choline dehydrogenase-like flavoprotein
MGLVPFSLFASFGNVGASYHVGNLCSDNKSLIDFQGSILNAPNLFIIDGSSLPILPAGPITLGIMANSRKITVESLRN